MSRLTGSNQAANDSAHQLQVHLVELELDTPTGTLRMATGARDIDWAGDTYTRGGHLLGFGEIEETAGLLVTSVNVALSGVDSSMTAIVLSERYLGRPLRILRGWLGEDGKLLAAPVAIFEGRMDRPTIQENPEDGSSTVAISASNIWVDFEHRPGRTTNHEQQQIFYPGDMGFQYAADIFKDLPWGRES